MTRKRWHAPKKTPGRTQLLNFFAVDEQRRVVDLPGYGYAKVAEDIKREWRAACRRLPRDATACAA